MTRRRAAATAALALAAGVLAARAQLERGATVTGFRIPEYDKEGKFKSQLFGDYAKVLAADAIDITNLRIEVFRDGQVDMRVAAPQCTYDRRAGTAASTSQVRITRANLVISGRGFTWNSVHSTLEIDNDTRVVVKDAGRTAGVAPQTGARP